MPKRREDYVTGNEGDEHHPAFGLISVHRISATPGAVLFQSDIRHPEYVRIEVHEATRKRDLAHDWVHPGKLLCGASMSMSQFASFVASGGTEGVPCTIEQAGSGSHEPGDRPGLNPASRFSVTHDEVRAAAAKAYADIKTRLGEYEEALRLTGAGAAAGRRNALRNLQAAVANAAPNVDYATRRLDEHAEEVVERSRADIEAMISAAQGGQRAVEAAVPAVPALTERDSTTLPPAGNEESR